MKKQVISVLVTLFMVISLFAGLSVGVGAQAEEHTLYFGYGIDGWRLYTNPELTARYYDNYNNDKYSCAENKLTLGALNGNFVFITNASTALVMPEDSTLELHSGTSNTVSSAYSGESNWSSGVFSDGHLTIGGSGSLNAAGGAASYQSSGIEASFLNIKGGKVIARGGEAEISSGINSEYIDLVDGTVTALGGSAKDSYGVFCKYELDMDGGTLTATGVQATHDSVGLSAGTIYIDAGTLDAAGGAAAGGVSYGIHAANVAIAGGLVETTSIFPTNPSCSNCVLLVGGSGTVYGNARLPADRTLAAGKTLTIPQSAILTVPLNTTLINKGTFTNNGTLTVNGEFHNDGTYSGGGTLLGGGMVSGVTGGALTGASTTERVAEAFNGTVKPYVRKVAGATVVRLKSDVTQQARLQFNDCHFILDLNGFKISGLPPKPPYSASIALLLKDGGRLTVIDSAEKSDGVERGVVRNTNGVAASVNGDRAELTVKSGTLAGGNISGVRSSVQLLSGKLTVNGGTLIGGTQGSNPVIIGDGVLIPENSNSIFVLDTQRRTYITCLRRLSTGNIFTIAEGQYWRKGSGAWMKLPTEYDEQIPGPWEDNRNLGFNVPVQFINVSGEEPSYSISADLSALDFGVVRTRYTQPAARMVTITNDSNRDVTVTLPSSENYDIAAVDYDFIEDTAMLAAGETARFTITPKTGLGVGVYDETLTVNGTSETSAIIDLAFTVQPPIIIDPEPGPIPGQQKPTTPPVTPPAPWVNPFTDVKATDWFYDAVKYCCENGLMDGVSVDEFKPEGVVSRAEVWQVLANLSGVETDTTKAPWYTDAQAWAMGAGVTDGTEPTGTVTREQLITMLYRYYTLIAKGEFAGGMSAKEFDDFEEVSGWAELAMQWGVSDGVIEGSDNRLNPQGAATRAELATMLMRFDKLLKR